MATVSIRYKSDGRITNQYYDEAPDDKWTETDEADWPEPKDDMAENEIPKYYYDESTGDITIQYVTIDTNTNA